MIFNLELFYQHLHPPPSNPCLNPTNPQLGLGLVARYQERETRISDGNASDDSGRQKRNRFATPAAPSGETLKKTLGSPIDAAQDHVTSHAGTLHDKLEKVVVCCAANFMTRRQNLHYKIASQQKLNSDTEYIPKYYQIKLELSVGKGTKEGKALSGPLREAITSTR